MFGLRGTQNDAGLSNSILLNQDGFYDAFIKDIARARQEVIIESPFISFKRLSCLLPTFNHLVDLSYL